MSNRLEAFNTTIALGILCSVPVCFAIICITTTGSLNPINPLAIATCNSLVSTTFFPSALGCFLLSTYIGLYVGTKSEHNGLGIAALFTTSVMGIAIMALPEFAIPAVQVATSSTILAALDMKIVWASTYICAVLVCGLAAACIVRPKDQILESQQIKSDVSALLNLLENHKPDHKLTSTCCI